jgi:hypothetical protein
MHASDTYIETKGYRDAAKLHVGPRTLMAGERAVGLIHVDMRAVPVLR